MIDTKALRSRVLDLAIRGKLTEQLSSDGTAEELYQQIQAEKQRFISNIKSEDIPFDIPSNWKWVRLGEIVSILGGKRIPAGRSLTTDNTGHKYIRVSDMKNMSVETSNLLYVPEDIYPKISRYIINKEDVYITVAGTIGRVGTIPDEIDGANLTENSDRLVFTSLDKNWLVFTLSADTVQKQISYLTTQVAQPKLAIKKIQEFILPLPPLAEQKRIVERVEEIFRILDTIDEAQEKYTADVESLKAKLITAGIQGKLTEQLDSDGTAEELYQQIQEEKQKLIKEGKIKKEKPLPAIKDEEIPFEIPENWKWVRLGSLLHGVTDGPHYSPKYIDSGIPFISTRNIANGKLDFSSAKYISPELHEELCKRCKPKKGDVLYSKGGTTGIAVVNDSDIEFNVWVHVAVLSMGANVNPYYLAMALNSPHCYGQSQEYTKGTANRDLGLTRMVKITLPLPPLAEQKRIAEVLEKTMGAVDRL
ncbi:MAG: restriction endonuclease subunit S [Ruminococcus sp.]|uniref:restriction endonuclease subunit S n=1 Tax=Ruminococcus sp. TaxID=41978 RepID=UPI0025D690F2|nr:restriction endonuclease subunit S [Ruminococcus sp.]MBR0529354.1 restriction endonuclease subunit S [Ruminococcus sp.]